MMRNYLSFGGGVNSVAMALMLWDMEDNFEAIYADHGCDWPETREYIQMLQGKGYPITIIDAGNLYDYAWDHKMVPSPQIRWCTRLFKVKPKSLLKTAT